MAQPVPVSRATRGHLDSSQGASHANLRCEIFFKERQP